VAIFIVHLSE